MKTAERLTALIVFMLSGLVAEGATRTAVTSGNWLTTSTWDCGCLPSGSDDVVIPPGITVTITIPGVVLNSLTVITVTVNGTLSIISSLLTVDANDKVRINPGGTIIAGGLGGSVFSGLTNVGLSPGSHIDGPMTILNGILPVTLLFFNATQSQTSVDLSWASASEKDFDYYRVERSNNGTDFTEVGEVRGNGNSMVRIDYRFSDEKPISGRSYYRLKAVDDDGTFVTSNIAAVNCGLGEKILLLYPNPIEGHIIKFEVNFKPGKSDYLVIRKSDGSNAEVILFKEGKNEIVLPEFSSQGTWILKMITSDQTFFSRVISE